MINYEIENFHVKSSSPDGHCLLYSIISGIHFTSGKFLDKSELEDKIRNETLENLHKYSELYETYSILIDEMNDYLYDKIYGSTFGDIVPQIIANVIPANLHIILHDDDSAGSPIHVMSQISGINIDLFLLKTNEHYDALLYKRGPIESSPDLPCRPITRSTTTRVWNVSDHDDCMHATSPNSGVSAGITCQQHVSHKSAGITCTNQRKSNITINNVFNSDGVKICFWNVHGLNSEFLEDEVCGTYLKTHDIILLCETWAGPDDNFELKGFYHRNYPRPHKHKNAWRRSGGLYIFIRNSIMKGIEMMHNKDDIIA